MADWHAGTKVLWKKGIWVGHDNQHIDQGVGLTGSTFAVQSTSSAVKRVLPVRFPNEPFFYKTMSKIQLHASHTNVKGDKYYVKKFAPITKVLWKKGIWVGHDYQHIDQGVGLTGSTFAVQSTSSAVKRVLPVRFPNEPFFIKQCQKFNSMCPTQMLKGTNIM